MGRFICLHSSDKNSKEIWINAYAIIVVVDMRPDYSYTAVVVSDLEYHVQETVESVIGLIKQQTNPLDNYVCPVPETVNDWSLGNRMADDGKE